MKFRHIIVIVILGSLGAIIGALFRIQHWPGGSVILIVSVLMEVLAAVFAVWRLLTIKDFSDFLNK